MMLGRTLYLPTDSSKRKDAHSRRGADLVADNGPQNVVVCEQTEGVPKQTLRIKITPRARAPAPPLWLLCALFSMGVVIIGFDMVSQNGVGLATTAEFFCGLMVRKS